MNLIKKHLEHIDIEINHKCNLACIHCSAQAKKGITSIELTTDEIKTILRNSVTLGLKKVGLTGGEPFLDSEKLKEICSFCLKEINIPLHTHSNGTLIDEKFIGENKELLLMFESISVTFLGGTAEIHDRITSTEGSFNKALNASELLACNDFPLTCYFVPSRGNCRSYKGLSYILAEKKIPKLRAMALAPSGRARNIYDSLVPESEEITEFQNNIMEVSAKTGIRIEAGYCTRVSMPHLAVLNGHEKCMSAINRVHINSKGDVFPCTAASGIPELSLGNLRDNNYNIKDIWENSELIKQLRDVHEGKIIECQDCKFKSKCMHGCMVNTFGLLSNEEKKNCPVMNRSISYK